MKDFESYWKDRFIDTYQDSGYVDNTMPVKDFKEYLRDAFEAGQNSRERKWIEGVPEHRCCNFLLVVKPKCSKYKRIVKAFYAEKFKVEIDCSNYDYGQNKNEDCFLKEGFYECAQWYNDGGLYFGIPEEDIIAWQPLPKISEELKKC